MPEDEAEDQAEVVQLRALMASLEPVREAVQGHRAWAIREGFNADAADDMAVALHDHLLAKFC